MRRRLLLAGPAAALAARPGRPWAALLTPPAFEVPPGACDCHVHVIPDRERFPLLAARRYTPPPAGPAMLLALQRALHLDRVVIVTPSVYGTDNRATLEGLRALGPGRARGVAVIDASTTPAQLEELHQAGIRGIRVNLETHGVADPAAAAQALRSAVALVQARGWHVQVYTRPTVIEALREPLAQLPVPLVIDHFGGARGAAGPAQPGFAALLELVRSGRAYVKLSGAYRGSEAAPAFPDMAPLARALIAANPDRILWGSDWPHTNSQSGRPPGEVSEPIEVDDGLLLNQLPVWAPEAAIRRRILVGNPARLYGFA
ncbi:amidohydrolase family protein [Roseicella frigidaeris]|nr:amidohydrolase family protein [Roseicella frigidaeris]